MYNNKFVELIAGSLTITHTISSKKPFYFIFGTLPSNSKFQIATNFHNQLSFSGHVNYTY